MTDEDDRVDSAADAVNAKASKRDRLKGALARTKSKFRKHGDKSDETDTLPDDVNEFLAGGRASISSYNSAPDGQSNYTSPGGSLPSARTSEQSTRPSTSDSLPFPKQSPRRIVVPRIDVSNSQRWPGAQPLGPNQSNVSHDFLRPENQTRSQSVSSLSKKRGHARGMSVTFIEAPPVVIGEGGDDAQAPTLAISQARARARSMSPMPNHTRAQAPSTTVSQSQSQAPSPTTSRAAMNEISGPPPPEALVSGLRHDPPDKFVARPLQRVQTGFSPTASPAGVSSLDKEFEMTLKPGSAFNSPDSERGSAHTTEILAPKPMRRIEPPAAVLETPEPPALKKEAPNSDLRRQFQKEGDALRMPLGDEIPDDVNEKSPPRFYAKEYSPEEARPNRWL